MSGWWLTSYVVIWILVIGLVLLLLGLARELGMLRGKLDSQFSTPNEIGLAMGSEAPTFAATAEPSGHQVRFPGSTAEQSLLVFVSQHCLPCQELMPVISSNWKDWKRYADLLVLCEGDPEDVKRFGTTFGETLQLIADPNGAIREAFGNPPTPFAFLVDSSSHIRWKGVVNKREDIERQLWRDIPPDGTNRTFSTRLPEVSAQGEFTPVSNTKGGLR